MKSPFPGMDPYLESRWREVHHNLISFTQAQLQPILPAGLRAGIDERTFFETLSGAERVRLPCVEISEGFLEIREMGNAGRAITAIEFISLANKQMGSGRDEYLRQHCCERRDGASAYFRLSVKPV